MNRVDVSKLSDQEVTAYLNGLRERYAHMRQCAGDCGLCTSEHHDSPPDDDSANDPSIEELRQLWEPAPKTKRKRAE